MSHRVRRPQDRAFAPHRSIGGFLGAGKTSLIVSAARLLQARGVKPAALLNDQGAELVDTRFVEANGIQAGTGGRGLLLLPPLRLVHAAEGLRVHMPEIIFAEAVGSCTDISATVLQPLKLEHAARFRVAPLHVLVDPERAKKWMDPGMDPELAFLFYKQIEEADLVCFSKADRFSEFPSLPGGSARFLSSHTGRGLRPGSTRFSAVGSVRAGRSRDRLRALRAGRGRAGLAELQRYGETGDRGAARVGRRSAAGRA